MRKNFIILFSLIISFNSISQNLPSYVPTDGLVGWWGFNGNANDESGNGNNGIVNGATLTTDRFGNENSAYYFKQDQYIDCGNSSSLGLTNNSVLTVCYWTSSPNKTWPFIKKYFNGYPGNSNYAFGGNGNTIMFTGNGTNVVELPEINDTSWIYICALFNVPKDSLTLYINGSFVISGKINLSNNISTSNLIFGPRINSFYPYPNGKLDDVGIWNRALSSYEINNLYKSGIVKCNKNLFSKGDTAVLKIFTVLPNPSFTWQSDFGYGFVNLSDNEKYIGTNTNTLSIVNVSLNNDMQPFRVIVSSDGINDTSNVIQFSVSCDQIILVYDTVKINLIDTTHVFAYDTIKLYVTDTTHVITYDTVRVKVADTLIIDIEVGVNQIGISKIKLYPNPAKNNLIINYENFNSMNNYSIMIKRYDGIVLYSTQINTQTSVIDISQWSRGLYFVYVLDEHNNIIETRKIILQ